MKKSHLINFLILLLLYLGLSSFPFLYFVNNEIWLKAFQIGVQIIFSIFAFIYVKKETEFTFCKPSGNKIIFIPCFLACASNFLYLAFASNDINPAFTLVIIPQIILYVFVAINEELIFRAIFISNSNYKTKLTTIIVSAAVFGVCHLTNFLSTFNPASLLTVVYTFLLGLMLGCIYVFTGSYIFVVSLHFAFNILNDVLFEALVPNVTNIWFYLLSNTIVTLFVAVYLVIIYFKKKGEK